MAVPKSIIDAKGLWRGKSQLNLPELPLGQRVTESDSTLHIDTDGRHTYATITYDWHYDGKRQEGTLIFTGSHKTETIEFGWVDSWHQNNAVMHLVGSSPDDGPSKAKGYYGGGEQPWGWSIEFIASNGHLAMNMENITPAGDATWAVRANYERA